jgi:RimJ/RimL family protein N-acetyltransferase
MTPELLHRYHQDFENDPCMYLNPTDFRHYEYCAQKTDAYFQKQKDLNRVFLAVMVNEEPVGEIIFKNIDPNENCCTMGIHLQNDSRKNQGIGTKAEMLALEYAFTVMNMKTVFADALIGNTRSQHVLKKVGFQEAHRDADFIYYRCIAEDRNGHPQV